MLTLTLTDDFEGSGLQWPEITTGVAETAGERE